MIERLTELWRGAGENSREVYGDRPLRTVRRAVSTGTHIYSAKPLQHRLADEFGDVTFEELPVRFQVCAASIERAAEHWFDSGPRGRRRRRERRRTRAAAAGAGRRRALPRRRHRELDPASAAPSSSGATRIFVLQVGRVDRPLSVPRRPWEVARVSFEIARRHRFDREMAELPAGVESPTCCPRAAPPRATTPCSAAGTSAASQRRIDATYDACVAYLDEHLGPDSRSGGR